MQDVKRPVFGKGKAYNDYGRGFYCTEHIELAKKWACTEGTDGYANKYEIETNGLSVLNLLTGDHTIRSFMAPHDHHAVKAPLGTEDISQQLLKNVKWGKQKSAEAGNVTFQYKKLLGYRRGADGKPEIVPEEAETVRRTITRRLVERITVVDAEIIRVKLRDADVEIEGYLS